jgi:hypothetical protein
VELGSAGGIAITICIVGVKLSAMAWYRITDSIRPNRHTVVLCVKIGDKKMLLKNRKNPGTLMTIGMSCLLLGVLWPNIVPHVAGVGPNPGHFLRGVLFGMSIAMNLMSIIIARRQRRCGGSSMVSVSILSGAL